MNIMIRKIIHKIYYYKVEINSLLERNHHFQVRQLIMVNPQIAKQEGPDSNDDKSHLPSHK